MVYKLATILIAVALVWQFYQVWKMGRRLVYRRDMQLVSRHRRAVWRVFWLSVLAVLLIEWQIQISPDPYMVNIPLFMFHLLIVAMLVAVFVAIMWRFSGERNPRWHAPFAYSFFTLYFLALGTGSVLLYQLP